MKKIFTFMGIVSSLAFYNAQIVINEIYTGGGILNALFRTDFIELKNIGSSTAALTGATIQYGTASGQFTQYHNLPTITLTPGQTYLIQQGSEGNEGVELLGVNLVVNAVLNLDDSSPIAGVGIQLALDAGKIALASNNVRVTGPTAPNVIDFVGYGSANQYEGAGAAPSPLLIFSITRNNADTNNNNVDFTLGVPTPLGSGSTLGVGDVNASKSAFIRNTLVNNSEIYFSSDVQNVQIFSMSGQLVKTANVKANSKLNVADLPKGSYIVTGTINSKKVTERILKE